VSRSKYYKIVFDDPETETQRTIGAYDDPWEAKRHATKFNKELSERMPVIQGKPFPFYYVSTELKSGTLPWIASLVDPATETMAGQSDPCVHCKVRAGQYGRRGLCVKCHGMRHIREEYMRKASFKRGS
jgi:nitrate/TMAO reductase-like tetraheme cytochrome c subunit